MEKNGQEQTLLLPLYSLKKSHSCQLYYYLVFLQTQENQFGGRKNPLARWCHRRSARDRLGKTCAVWQALQRMKQILN